MSLPRMCRLKDIPERTGGLLTPYKARLLFLQGKIAGVRLGGRNSPILINLDHLEKYLESESLKNLQSQITDYEYGRLRRLD